MSGPKKNDAPRWEWRIFDDELSDIEAKIGLATQVAPRLSEETYLLCPATPHSAKIRGGALEVKRLLCADDDGLELWSPAFRAAFPLSAEAAARAFEALDLEPPRLANKDYDAEALGRELTLACPDMRPVAVQKARRQFFFLGCAGEFVRVRVGSLALKSFALESADRSTLVAALRELGLAPNLDTNFPRGIAQALSFAQAGVARREAPAALLGARDARPRP